MDYRLWANVAIDGLLHKLVVPFPFSSLELITSTDQHGPGPKPDQTGARAGLCCAVAAFLSKSNIRQRVWMRVCPVILNFNSKSGLCSPLCELSFDAASGIVYSVARLEPGPCSALRKECVTLVADIYFALRR